MTFVLMSSIVTLHDPYFYEIILPINADHGKFFFIFDKPNIFAIISLEDWWKKWKQAIALPLHIKCKYVSLSSKQTKWTIHEYFCHTTKGLLLWQLYLIQQLLSPSLWVKQLDSNVMVYIELFIMRAKLGFQKSHDLVL